MPKFTLLKNMNGMLTHCFTINIDFSNSANTLGKSTFMTRHCNDSP